MTGVHVDGSGMDLTLEGLIGADQQLLTRLSTSVEGALHLDATEGTVVEQATVLTGERNTLGDALVDDVRADRGQTVDVRLAGAVVAALHGVVEQAVDGVTVVLVVLRSVDAALGGDGMGTTRRVLVTEVLDAVTSLTKGGSSGATGQTSADDDDGHLAAVGRVDQTRGELTISPDLLDRKVVVGLRVMNLIAGCPVLVGQSGVVIRRSCCSHQEITPNRIRKGGTMKPTRITMATIQEHTRSTARAVPETLTPRVAKALQKPWETCMHTAMMAMR